MSKIMEVFKDNKAFIGFLTAGDPSKEKTIEYILAMEKAGADIIEIGIPFSDPIAEGSVIQDANTRALDKGINTDEIFDLVIEVRKKSDVPLVFLTYINPVFYYGYEKFFKRCYDVGIDGIVIPDLPYEEKSEILEFAKKYKVDIISLIAPTSHDRIKMIAKNATGFIYLVSSMGVTGVRNEIRTDLGEIVGKIKKITDVPVAVGFGINTPEQSTEIAKIADGVIVGSAIVKIIEKHGYNSKKYIEEYVTEMKNATKI